MSFEILQVKVLFTKTNITLDDLLIKISWHVNVLLPHMMPIWGQN